ncbi:MAG: UDP-N-acetylglucosamine 2-epimerase (non-hydrolyzing) [Defluviitaleaceae bacterium]|nr:UDP-N-acetylglucosamine 2-epimerase (non-hydrolyzing) [Defluviitaleaceae bacterium]
MAPVVRVLSASLLVESVVCVTAQHRDMLDSVLDIFGIKPDFDLNIMTAGQNLAEITTKALNGLMDVISRCAPDLVLVHGDTTTTMAASLAAYYSRVRLGHVEAGLRTHNKYAPFPEEVNRRIAGVAADLHFAPTEMAKANLLAENVADGHIFVTGNTAIDAIDGMVKPDYHFKADALNKLDFKAKRIIAMTAHRRENHGKPLEDICKAVLAIKRDFGDVEVVYPVHPSPVVLENARKILAGADGIHLIDPVDIVDMHNLLSRSHLVLTDSGGLQEEAPHHNVPVVVLRQVTERPEGLEAGCLVLGGDDTDSVYNAVKKLLTNKNLHTSMAEAKNPFGDGCASQRILKAILEYFRK